MASSKNSRKSHKKSVPKKTRDLNEVDISKHYLVPKHEKIDEQEKQELLRNYNIKLSDLPRIKISDPAIRKLEVKPGDVIKIIRDSPTAGESIYYRVVIED
ncbi:DNA-directed RNA polymerase subunit H [Nanobdella aerobiophila]|uniref:DNA-directed RNA polymerase subunit Rpo5 n=1 Tax=Nanobdella aerobiophila TaxID=2586965 RepID=A0A915SJW6_9ARCH|nr:DNA-directed RNA polymerase subunit H [Nanobdella aerobiophila]BBL45293.1 DNA-directed RNA polymerase subunit H [Nanobdella aerobiophila]